MSFDTSISIEDVAQEKHHENDVIST